MCVHTLALLLIFTSPLCHRPLLPVFPPYFQLGKGEDKSFILSNYTLPTTLPINNSTSPLYVLIFLVYFHITVSVVLYVVTCYVPSKYRKMGIGKYVPCTIFTAKMLPHPLSGKTSVFRMWFGLRKFCRLGPGSRKDYGTKFSIFGYNQII